MTGNTLRFVHTCCATACCWPEKVSAKTETESAQQQKSDSEL
eukprot:CAMPEP_0115761580 /NCGR_PEP_ID=MMETSP0272-20121206/100578_1 /TAXON_ID=71861 /ORGANISM="Scrippsiella trochoidea, Strain CCMP3099" /LENGTH=41 /DNA_ID= /DNA_START= /DNA_END= /DNA_ORIENTATION=